MKENSTSDYALVAAAKTYAAIGLRQKAMDTFAKALSIKPLAYIYVNRSEARPFADVAGRLSDLDSALRLEPDFSEALVRKAELLSRQGRHTEAIKLYDEAIKADLDPSYWQLGRAIALHKAGRTVEAKKVFDTERSKATTSSELSRLCSRKAIGDVLLKSALEDCQEALRLDPSRESTFENLGLVYLKLNDPLAALKAYDKAVSERGGASALMGRAIAYARNGDDVRAATDAAQARKMLPDVDDLFAEYGLRSELQPTQK